MSFLLDPPALLLLGFLAGKSYYLLTVFGDRVFRRGAQRKNLLIIGAIIVVVSWAYSAALYLNLIYFPWPLPHWYGGTNWMLNSGLPLGLTRNSVSDIAALVIFATYPLWFYIGTELGLAGHRMTDAQRMKERDRIVRDLAATMFPRGGAIPPGAGDVDSAASVESLLTVIPSLFGDALTVLLFAFDSRFFVLAFTGKWKRFVDLDADESSVWEKSRYIEAWESNTYLLAVAQTLKIAMSYAYYTKPLVYEVIGYNGPMIPNVPSWHNQGPAPSATTETSP
ncbi:MAG: hypothetical protein OK474_08695 [Thaumarchaeota archaeon]|nr:hypothetical protein [Nitrososphaerota archaeon]